MYTHILVPLDRSDLAEQALPHAESLVRSFGATLHLVQVISIPHELASLFEAGTGGPPLGDPGLNLGHLLVEASRSAAQKYLDNLAGRYRDNGIEVETAVLEGIADEEILEYAQEHGIDCIVVTTQGNAGIRHFLLGSISDRIIRSSKVPVVVVPPRV